MVVKCINNSSTLLYDAKNELTLGKKYEVLYLTDEHYTIRNDLGASFSYRKDRFIETKEIKNIPKESV
jgi:hypothetical protein